ncbi:MAG TPA: hypothetical protein VGI48_05250 [Caldimonas sp.]
MRSAASLRIVDPEEHLGAGNERARLHLAGRERRQQAVLASARGFLVAHWVQGGMRHWVIRDVNREEFQRLVDALRAVTTTG